MTPPFKRIPWIFFDLDDTIWNFSENSTTALNQLYEISPILRKLFKDIHEFIEIYHQHNARMWELYANGEVSTAELKTERWRRTLATRQFEVLTAVCEELDRNYLDILARCKASIKGAQELLANLQKKALIGVISNGFFNTQYKKLNNSGLNRYITRMIVSQEIEVNKPDKRIFEYAVAETGASGPWLYVGDHPATDIMGALRAGWHAIWVNKADHKFKIDGGRLEEEGINPELFLGVAGSLEEARPLIEKFLSVNHAQTANP